MEEMNSVKENTQSSARKNLKKGVTYIIVATAFVFVFLIIFQGDARTKEKKVVSEENKEQAVGAMPESNENLAVSATVTTATGKIIKVRVAESQKERGLGLSNFDSLAKDEGMLFLFNKRGVYPFWMKDMKFSIDIIWLKSTKSGAYTVVHIAESVAPATYPNIIDPKTEADAVLEVGMRRGAELGITVGSEIVFAK